MQKGGNEATIEESSGGEKTNPVAKPAKSSSPPPEPASERPPKRRRIEDDAQNEGDWEVEEVDGEEINPETVDAPEILENDVNDENIGAQQEVQDFPVGVLPRFPLPSLPDAPSKTALALQGLDRKLIEAEIVDPSTILPIIDSENQNGIRLEPKTTKRLDELGITELFAGTLLARQSVSDS